MMYQILLSIYEYGVKILDKTAKHVCSQTLHSGLRPEAACLRGVGESAEHPAHCQIGTGFVTLTLICNCLKALE